MHMKDDPIAIARASCAAYERKDRSAIEALIAEDFHFSSPLDNRLDRKTYFARCWPNSKNIEAFDFIQIARDREKVFVTYEARNVDGTRFRNTELLTVHEHQITEVEVYFGWSIPHPAAAGGFVNSSS